MLHWFDWLASGNEQLVEGFEFDGFPSRVVFGAGSLSRVGAEAVMLGCSRVLVVSTAGRQADAQRALTALGDRGIGLHAGAEMHTPVAVTEAALKVVSSKAVDGLVAVGGGSSIGLTKAIALRTALPQIAIPSTYAGSEVTPVIGQTDNGIKTTTKDARVLPRVVIYDVEMTMALPLRLTATSALNAMAHAVEALYSRNTNPLTTTMALEGLRRMAHALGNLERDPSNQPAREDALYGAWLCGMCLASAGMALHHKICHVLGGTFGLPHSDVHAVMLPHVVAYNAKAAEQAMAAASEALGGDAPTRLRDLSQRLGGPVALAELGMAESDIDEAVRLASTDSYWNPRPIEAGPLRAMLQGAYEGAQPVSY